MALFRALAALLCLAVFASASDPLVFRRSRPWVKTTADGLTIDLRGQFDPMTRRQGRYGTCSAFAAVAVAEAAADRNAHRCVRLSEADIYLQGNVLKWECWKDPKKDCNKSGAGTSLIAMLHGIITSGVLAGDDYDKFMAAYQKSLEEDRAVAEEPRDTLHAAMSFLRNPFNDELLSQLMNWDQKAVRKHLESYASASRRGDLRRARLGVARSFSGYRLVRGFAEDVRNRWEMKPGSECFERGKKIASFIDGELLAGRPVGIGMYVGDLKGWPTDAKGGESGHAFVIDGLTLTRDARGVKKVYRTRNSWPAQPAVHAEDLCRVDAAVSLLGPGEHEAPANPWASLR